MFFEKIETIFSWKSWSTRIHFSNRLRFMVCSNIEPVQFPVQKSWSQIFFPTSTKTLQSTIHQPLPAPPGAASAGMARLPQGPLRVNLPHVHTIIMSDWEKMSPVWSKESSPVTHPVKQTFLSWGDVLQEDPVCFCSRTHLSCCGASSPPHYTQPRVWSLWPACREKHISLCLYCLPESWASAPSATLQVP